MTNRGLGHEDLHADHGRRRPRRALAGEAFDAVLTGGMGRRAVQSMNNAGIRVFQLADATVAEAVAAMKLGRLAELTPAAACGGHGHGHGHRCH